MNPQTDSDSCLLPTIVGIALLLLIVAAGARMMGLLPNSIGGFGSIDTFELLSEAAAEPSNPSQAPRDGRATRRCPECGVIVSMRAIDANASNASNASGGAADLGDAKGVGGTQGPSVNRYEFVVRLQGGARRVIIDTIPTRWREGERVVVIDGTSPSRQ